jgi:hypothetical protein
MYLKKSNWKRVVVFCIRILMSMFKAKIKLLDNFIDKILLKKERKKKLDAKILLTKVHNFLFSVLKTFYLFVCHHSHISS